MEGIEDLTPVLTLARAHPLSLSRYLLAKDQNHQQAAADQFMEHL